jgi:hypothetical protein
MKRDLSTGVRIKAPGSPWAYWVDTDIAKKVLSKESKASDKVEGLGRFSYPNDLAKYMAEYSEKSLETSICGFFHDLANRNADVTIELREGEDLKRSSEDISSLYLANWLAKSRVESEHSDGLANDLLADSSEILVDSDIKSICELGQTPSIAIEG